ncbi:unnamed protein product [Thlaspi arvense]|uniref:Anaphase-promoting complex subunit 11 n=2 Tax=Brassicaceae TaxID=3700 RepID=A0AAU9S209_THLAR|nr:unnamed protein product [Thlaspi arvense]
MESVLLHLVCITGFVKLSRRTIVYSGGSHESQDLAEKQTVALNFHMLFVSCIPQKHRAPTHELTMWSCFCLNGIVCSGNNRWHAVASWTWDAQDETCGICRMAFDGCCPDCKLPGDDCPLIWGACNHAFHLHCILKWVNSQTSQAHCPMCRREWQFKE